MWCFRFTVNLLSETSDNIPFHFDVRVDYMCERRVIVMNTLKADSWGREERDTPPFPFTPGQEFTLVISATDTCFMVRNENTSVYLSSAVIEIPTSFT